MRERTTLVYYISHAREHAFGNILFNVTDSHRPGVRLSNRMKQICLTLNGRIYLLLFIIIYVAVLHLESVVVIVQEEQQY